MNLKSCFELFKIGPDATVDEVNRAYRDLVNVWHPDRFAHNPRLQQKVQTQLKEINVARDKLLAYCELREQAPKTKAAAQRWARARARAREQADKKAAKESGARTAEDAQAEAATGADDQSKTGDRRKQGPQANTRNRQRTRPSKKSRQAIEKEVNRLPLIDVTIWKVITLLDDPNSNFEQIAEQVSPDIATRFLSMASSAFYGRKVESINYAVRVLGYGQMKKLLITSMLFGHFTKHLRGFSFAKFQNQAHFCAAVAKSLGQMLDYDKPEDLFTVAMLQNIGKLVLAVYFKDHHRHIVAMKQTERIGTGDAEMQVLGMTHAEVGALLLKRFNIPQRICDAVMFHDIQDPIVLGKDDYQLILITKEATRIVRRFTLPAMEEPLKLLVDLDDTIRKGRQALGQKMERAMHDKSFQTIFPELLEAASGRIYRALKGILQERGT